MVVNLSRSAERTVLDVVDCWFTMANRTVATRRRTNQP